jgi:endonuclease/exonuclease/phosphatase family metal-dependent hydrolase
VRLKNLGQVLSYIIPGKTIICGDFNIAENKMYIRGTGWLRGYKKKDYQIKERTVVNEIIKQTGSVNIFQNKNSTRLPIKLQFDHILIPKGMSLIRNKLLNVKGTEHRACVVEI